MMLKYLRQYVTQKELAYEFDVGEATVHDTIVWVENTLVKDEKFKLPGKKVLLEDDSIEVILVDVTEYPIERPKKNNVSGTRARRKKHHFKLYKNTIGGRVLDRIKDQLDSGYQGITQLHKNSETPKKKSKGIYYIDVFLHTYFKINLILFHMGMS